MFDDMISTIREETVKELYKVHVIGNRMPTRQMMATPNSASHGDGSEPQKKKPVRVENKPGRNDPCPCGSGKKYKKCCGLNE